MIKYIKYLRICRSLNIARRNELDTKEFLEEIGIDYEDLNLRNINKRIDKVKATWLRRNAID